MGWSCPAPVFVEDAVPPQWCCLLDRYLQTHVHISDIRHISLNLNWFQTDWLCQTERNSIVPKRMSVLGTVSAHIKKHNTTHKKRSTRCSTAASLESFLKHKRDTWHMTLAWKRSWKKKNNVLLLTFEFRSSMETETKIASSSFICTLTQRIIFRDERMGPTISKDSVWTHILFPIHNVLDLIRCAILSFIITAFVTVHHSYLCVISSLRYSNNSGAMIHIF